MAPSGPDIYKPKSEPATDVSVQQTNRTTPVLHFDQLPRACRQYSPSVAWNCVHFAQHRHLEYPDWKMFWKKTQFNQSDFCFHSKKHCTCEFWVESGGPWGEEWPFCCCWNVVAIERSVAKRGSACMPFSSMCLTAVVIIRSTSDWFIGLAGGVPGRNSDNINDIFEVDLGGGGGEQQMLTTTETSCGKTCSVWDSWLAIIHWSTYGLPSGTKILEWSV